MVDATVLYEHLAVVYISLAVWVPIEQVAGDCVIKSLTECDDLCSDDLADPRNFFVSHVSLTGVIADFRCLVGLDHIEVSGFVKMSIRLERPLSMTLL